MLEGVLSDKLEKRYRDNMDRPFTWTGLAKEILIIGQDNAKKIIYKTTKGSYFTPCKSKLFMMRTLMDGTVKVMVAFSSVHMGELIAQIFFQDVKLEVCKK